MNSLSKLSRNWVSITSRNHKLVAFIERFSLVVNVSVHQLVLSWFPIQLSSCWMNQPLVLTPSRLAPFVSFSTIWPQRRVRLLCQLSINQAQKLSLSSTESFSWLTDTLASKVTPRNHSTTSDLASLAFQRGATHLTSL